MQWHLIKSIGVKYRQYFLRKYRYWYRQYFQRKVLVSLLAILFASIVNKPGDDTVLLSFFIDRKLQSRLWDLCLYVIILVHCWLTVWEISVHWCFFSTKTVEVCGTFVILWSKVVNIAILKVLHDYWQYFLGIASILPMLSKFSIDSCIAILFYSSYVAIQMAIIFLEIDQFLNFTSLAVRLSFGLHLPVGLLETLLPY